MTAPWSISSAWGSDRSGPASSTWRTWPSRPASSCSASPRGGPPRTRRSEPERTWGEDASGADRAVADLLAAERVVLADRVAPTDVVAVRVDRAGHEAGDLSAGRAVDQDLASPSRSGRHRNHRQGKQNTQGSQSHTLPPTRDTVSVTRTSARRVSRS